MATIRSRTGKWVVDFRYMGIRCRETTFMTDSPANLKKLEKIMEKMEAELILGTFKYSTYFPKSPKVLEMEALNTRKQSFISNTPNFKEFSEIWFAEKQVEWRISYKRKIATTLSTYILPYFGQKLVDQINKADLLGFRASLAKVTYGKRQENLSASRINQIMTPLRMILEEAADRYSFVTPYRNIKTLKELKPDVMPFTLEEVWKIINNVRTDFKYYYIVRFFTGMRTSEIDALKWKNIDFNRREIRIREALVDGHLGTPKTYGSSRDMPMSNMVYEALWKQYNYTSQRSEFVFCNRKGGPLDYRLVNRRIWHPTLMILGITPRRAYQTRHTAATLWLAAGENPEWIARQMGHSTTEMLFRVYSRYVPDITRRDGSAFEQLIQQSQQEPEGV